MGLTIRAWVVAALWAVLALSPPRADAGEDAEGASLAEATRLEERAIQAYRAARYAEAARLARESLAIRERILGREHPTVGDTCETLGLALLDDGKFEGALEALGRVLAIREKTDASAAARIASAVNNVAEVHRMAGRSAASVPLYRRALALFEEAYGPDHAEVAVAANNLGLALQEVDRNDEALSLLERALILRERLFGADSFEASQTRVNLSVLLLDLGRLADADAANRRGLEGLERAVGPRHPAVAGAVHNLARVRAGLGDRDGARALMERGLSLAEELLGPEHPETGHSLLALGTQLSYEGQFEQAEPLLRRALKVFEASMGKESTLAGLSRSSLGGLLFLQRRFEEAEPFLVEALAIAEKSLRPGHPRIATQLHNLAGLYRDAERPEKALALYERALALQEAALGPEHPDRLLTQNNYATVLFEVDRLEEARALLDRVLAAREKVLGPDHPDVVSTLSDATWAALLQGRLDDARALSSRMIATLAKDASVRIARMYGPERLSYARVVRRSLDRFLGWAPRLGTTGYEEVLRLKGLVARAEAAERRAARGRDPRVAADLEALRASERRVSRLANAVPPTFRAEARAAWQEEYARALADRRRRTEATAPVLARAAAEEAPLSRIQAGLRADEALVDVLRSRDRYRAWIVRREGPPVAIDLGEAEPMDAAAEAFFEAVAASGPGDRSWRAAGERLAQRLAPLLGALPPAVTRLVLAPDGALAGVPFAAIPLGPSEHLGDRYRLASVSMAQHLAPTRTSRPAFDRALLVGAVDYARADASKAPRDAAAPPSLLAAGPSPRAARGGAFVPLENTRREIDAVAARLGAGARTLTGAHATEAATGAAAAGVRLLHVATHGRVRTDLARGLRTRAPSKDEGWGTERDRLLAPGHDPLHLAGLALAGVNSDDGGGGDDGFLTASEVSWLDLDACELVVLSACQTARGTAESGQGVLGLVQGFELAGARHVVASLWDVDDRATRLLMERFYAALLRPGSTTSPADALSDAARWLRDEKPEGLDASAPSLWAAFVCYERR